MCVGLRRVVRGSGVVSECYQPWSFEQQLESRMDGEEKDGELPSWKVVGRTQTN